MNLAAHRLNVSIQRAQKRYVLAQPIIPKTIEITDQLHTRLNAALNTLRRLPRSAPALVTDKLKILSTWTLEDLTKHAAIAPLHHRLGKLSVARNGSNDAGVSWRSIEERVALDERCKALLQAIEDPSPDEFVEEVLAVSSLVKKSTTPAFRKAAVKLTGDRTGWHWQFPDSKGIFHCLAKLHFNLHRRNFENAIVEATVAYVIFNWMHPFSDGNGRTSRVLFNAILRRHGMSAEHYLPIKEINYLAQGGHDVRLRYTVATGDWGELLEYFCNAAELLEVLLRQEPLLQSNGGLFTSIGSDQ